MIISQLSSVAVDGGQPRFHRQEREKLDAIAGNSSTTIRPQHRRLHDPSVTFEEYYYYAQQTRAEEEVKASHKTGIFSIIFPSKNDGSVGILPYYANTCCSARSISYISSVRWRLRGLGLTRRQRFCVKAIRAARLPRSRVLARWMIDIVNVYVFVYECAVVARPSMKVQCCNWHECSFECLSVFSDPFKFRTTNVDC